MSSHFFGIQPKPDGKTLFTSDVDGRNALHSLQPILDLLFSQIGHFQGRESIAAHANPNNRPSVRVLFGDDWLVDVFGQAAPNSGDPVSDILCSDVDVTGEIELNGDVTNLFPTLTAQRLDASDVVDGFFQAFGNFRLDHGGVGAWIHRRHIDDGRINVGQFTNGKLSEADGTK